jgi:serine/threonine-protein kinase
VGAVERTPAPIPTPPVSTPPPAPPQPSEGPSPLPLVLALAAGLAGLVLVGVGLLLRRRGATPAYPPPVYPPPVYAPPAPPPARPAHIPATSVIPTDGAATVPDAPVWQGTSPDALAQTIAATPPPSGVWCARCGTPSPADARFCPTDGADLRTHGTTVDPNARPPTDTRPDMKPFAVGRYRCESRLGEGGMGVVYRASDVETGAACAVKVLLVRGRAEGPLAERFRKEARLAAAVRHPNCVAIYDYGEVAGQLFYLAMELVDGRSLDAALEGRAMPPPRVASIVGQVCDALAAAHAAGIVHRDLKPQNVMVRDGDVVKLVDFGIARDLNAAKTTLAGVVVGTPAYMAPEQARAEAGVDGRADVFSVGVMAWELLTGRLPYEPAGNAIQQVVARATLRDSAPPTGVSPAVDDVLARATAPDPARRTPDVRTLAAELGAALQAA